MALLTYILLSFLQTALQFTKHLCPVISSFPTTVLLQDYYHYYMWGASRLSLSEVTQLLIPHSLSNNLTWSSVSKKTLSPQSEYYAIKRWNVLEILDKHLSSVTYYTIKLLRVTGYFDANDRNTSCTNNFY